MQTVETEVARTRLRDLAEARLSLYIQEMGEEFYGKLIANKANWRAGYIPQHDEFWVLPQTDTGHIIVGPFTAVKWTYHELCALRFPSEGFGALAKEAREAGFEQWATEETA